MLVKFSKQEKRLILPLFPQTFEELERENARKIQSLCIAVSGPAGKTSSNIKRNVWVVLSAGY